MAGIERWQQPSDPDMVAIEVTLPNGTQIRYLGRADYSPLATDAARVAMQNEHEQQTLHQSQGAFKLAILGIPAVLFAVCAGWSIFSSSIEASKINTSPRSSYSTNQQYFSNPNNFPPPPGMR